MVVKFSNLTTTDLPCLPRKKRPLPRTPHTPLEDAFPHGGLRRSVDDQSQKAKLQRVNGPPAYPHTAGYGWIYG